MESLINEARSSLDFAQLGELKGRAKRREEGALRETAEQFEAMFLQMMLKTMRDAVPRSGFMDSDSVKTYESMYDRELALHLARKNSVGIADMLVNSLSKRKGMDESAESFLSRREMENRAFSLEKVKKPLILNSDPQGYSISQPEESSFPLRSRASGTYQSDAKGLRK